MNKRYFWKGFLDMIPFALVLVPFGLLFGAVATEAGFDIVQTMVISLTVLAGAAQFTAVAMMQDHAPTLIILLASLGVNLRMAMYSASLVRHFGSLPMWQRVFVAYGITDQTFAVTDTLMTDDPKISQAVGLRYYFGGLMFIAPIWLIAVLIGVFIGGQIPPEYALDFAMPILFIALFGPMIRSAPHAIGALVSIICGLAFAGLPYSIGLILAAIVAIMVAAQVELWLKRRMA